MSKNLHSLLSLGELGILLKVNKTGIFIDELRYRQMKMSPKWESFQNNIKPVYLSVGELRISVKLDSATWA
jgi:hypothetical protein